MVQARPARASQVIGSSCHSGRVPSSLRSCLIFTAHAHRKKAAVGAITRTITTSTMRMVRFLFLPRHTGWRFGRLAAKSALVAGGRRAKATRRKSDRQKSYVATEALPVPALPRKTGED